MRKAIIDTNVKLDLAISPGISLVPSNLIILDKKIKGFSNILKTAIKNMKFGVNEDINLEESESESESDSETETTIKKNDEEKILKINTSQPLKGPKKYLVNEAQHSNNLISLLGFTLGTGLLVSRFL